MTYLGKRKLQLESKVSELEKAISDERNEFNDETYFEILSKANDIPSAILKSYSSKLRKISDDEKDIGFKAEKAYCDEVKKFALTLFGYSKKSYEYVRETFQKCLPAVSTIKKWLNKVDGSPGFNDHALAQLKRIVQEKEMLGQKVTRKQIQHLDTPPLI